MLRMRQTSNVDGSEIMIYSGGDVCGAGHVMNSRMHHYNMFRLTLSPVHTSARCRASMFGATVGDAGEHSSEQTVRRACL
uniref:Uncharacterized protein n=1 Tax=Romanomermis culicivorax TaxID=13658 RepID=A0A915IFD9_ROMCU